jgi:hypothetical protein
MHSPRVKRRLDRILTWPSSSSPQAMPAWLPSPLLPRQNGSTTPSLLWLSIIFYQLSRTRMSFLLCILGCIHRWLNSWSFLIVHLGCEFLLLESWSPGLNASSQITREGFWGKGNKVYYLSDKEEDRESPAFQSSEIPLLRENVCFLKGRSGAQFEYMTKCMSPNRCWPWFTRCPGTTSLKLYVLADRFTSVVV